MAMTYMWLDEAVSEEEFRARLRERNRLFLQLNKGYARAQQEPWPLCIDGHEYHRRQRRRVKRR